MYTHVQQSKTSTPLWVLKYSTLDEPESSPFQIPVLTVFMSDLDMFVVQINGSYICLN